MVGVSSNAREVAAKLRAFKVTNAIVETIDATAPVVIAALKKEAPYGERHGNEDRGPHLRDRIFVERHSAIGHVFASFETDRTPVAGWVLSGTKAHEIHPKGEWPLRFYWERVGAEVESWGWHGERFGYVEHPGTKANPFNLRAWIGVETSVLDALVDRLEVSLV